MPLGSRGCGTLVVDFPSRELYLGGGGWGGQKIVETPQILPLNTSLGLVFNPFSPKTD